MAYPANVKNTGTRTFIFVLFLMMKNRKNGIVAERKESSMSWWGAWLISNPNKKVNKNDRKILFCEYSRRKKQNKNPAKMRSEEFSDNNVHDITRNIGDNSSQIEPIRAYRIPKISLNN